MFRMIVRHEASTYRVDVPEGPAILGADPACDIWLPVPGVSRRHARVETFEGGLRLQDLGSKNGLVIAGTRRTAMKLRPGDRVWVGRGELTLEEVEGRDATVSVALSHRWPAPSERDASTESDVGAASTGVPGDLLRRLREVSAAADGPRPADVGFLRAVVENLGARHLFFVSTRDGCPETGRVLGAPASPRLIEAASCQARGLAERTTLRFALEGLPVFFLRCGPRSTATRAAALVVDPAPASLEPWQEDLLDLLLQTIEGKGSTGLHAADPLVYPPGFVPTRSPTMGRLLADLRAAVASNLDVLLLGETGTGKEFLAAIVHESGPTRLGPFVPINCAAIPSELLEAELFGVKSRVATGVDARPGLLVRARGGCVFLDEIGDMPVALQAKLLRALAEREVWPIGGHQPEPIQVRIVSSTNRDLPALVRQGQFRADLFYRLRGLELRIPPLRQRPEDITELATHFAAQAAKAHNRDVAGISGRAMDLLLAHDWPGNVRELQTTIERAVLLCPSGGVLSSRELEPVLEPRPSKSAVARPAGSAECLAAPHPQADLPRDLGGEVKALERRVIGEALARFGGNKSRAARYLGITRNGLALKMRRLGLSQ